MLRWIVAVAVVAVAVVAFAVAVVAVAVGAVGPVVAAAVGVGVGVEVGVGVGVAAVGAVAASAAPFVAAARWLLVVGSAPRLRAEVADARWNAADWSGAEMLFAVSVFAAEGAETVEIVAAVEA